MTAPDAQVAPESQTSTGAGAPFAEQPNKGALAIPSSAALHLVGPPKGRPKAMLVSAVPDLSGFAELRLLAECFDDAQDARKRIMNRLGLKANGTPQKTGTRVPEVFFAGQVEAAQLAEKRSGKALDTRYLEVVPPGVRVWQEQMFGIGVHLLARLLGALGHPRIATPYHWEGEGAARKLIPDLQFERSVRQLWSYCGHGDATRKKRKGMTADEAFMLGSPRCKMLTHLLAESTIKCRVAPKSTAGATGLSADPTPSADQPSRASNAECVAADRRYRAIYDQRRAHTAATHPDWSDGHSHNDALRIVGKAILADLWAAS